MSDMHKARQSKVKRIPERGVYDRETIYEILDEGLVGHVGFVVDGRPYVMPMLYVRIGDTLCIHGSPASRMLRALASGIEACVTVTLLDGLVLARSAFHHSANYRSAVIFGTASRIDDPVQKLETLRALSDHILRGRWEDVRPPSDEELMKTLVLGIAIDEASAKIRTGPPLDEESDYDLAVWAGVLPIRVTTLPAIPDPRLPLKIPAPSYLVRNLP